MTQSPFLEPALAVWLMVLTTSTLTVTALTPATYSVGQSSTNGVGSGAIYTMASDSSGNYTVTDITTFGENYALNDQVTILDQILGAQIHRTMRRSQ